MNTPAPPSPLASFPAGGLALVIGASGGLGAAMADALDQSGRFAQVWRAVRHGDSAVDLLNEASIAALAERVRGSGLTLRLAFDATGFLHDTQRRPERAWRELDPAHLAYAFAVNAIGPALLMKHLLPLLPAEGKAAFATLSAKVGSIGDNRLGGWYGYRASKAALNQLVRTAAVELKRSRPQALCVALHPGTVRTRLSTPFTKTGLEVREPAAAAALLVSALEQLGAGASGGFFDFHGEPLPF